MKIWHNSALNTLRHCEQQFVYSEVEGLKATEVSVPLLLGSWFHALMYAQGLRQGIMHDTLLMPVPKAMDLGFDGLAPVPLSALPDPESREFTQGVHMHLINEVHDRLPTGDPEIDDLPERVWFLYERYIARHFETLISERVLLVEHEWQREDRGVTYGGKVDRVVQRSDRLVVVRDYKTTSTIPTADFRLANSQLHLYGWGLAPLLDEHGLTVNLIEYDYAKTYVPSMRLTKAGNLYKNQKVIDEYAAIKMLTDLLEVDFLPDQFLGYIEKCREEGDEEFFPRKTMPVNETVIMRLLEEQDVLISRGNSLIEGALPVRNIGRACQYACDYTALCVGEMYGNDVSPLLAMFR